MYSEDAIPFVEAVQIAHDMFAVNGDPLHNQPHTSSVIVPARAGLTGHPDGRIVQPPSGGWGCRA
eukprot:5448001-Pyramimonas_sp.AAC.1